jgi:hypothetical protein
LHHFSLSVITLFSEASTHNDAHTTPTAMDSSAWARGTVTPATVVHRSFPQALIPGLPDHLVVAHILRSEYFDDRADLARLPAVSRAMRDAVAATGPWDKEALCKAAQNGHEAMVRGLIEAGADVNEAKDDASPLYIAAEFGHEAVVRALIEAKSDLEWTDFVDGERRCTSPLLKATPRLCAY